MGIGLLEWIGYTASVIIAISMFMASVVKFRWINFFGALLFSIYGFLIGAIPVGILNGIIVLTDVYYLIIIYKRKDIFEVLEVQPNDPYMQIFIKFHKQDINKFFPNFTFTPNSQNICYLVLRNVAVAGVFIAKVSHDSTLEVELDYVRKEFRDFKNGRFVYHWLKSKLNEHGYNKLWAYGGNKDNINYLKKMGFAECNGRYCKVN